MPDSSRALTTVFMGTPNFSADILEGLVGTGFEPVAVYTQPDRPAGRGRRATAPPVANAAARSGIPVHQPVTLRDSTVQQQLAAYRPDVIIVVAYGLLLPSAVLAIPPLHCINIHASLLPRWRGAAPIQRAIESGDAETGVSLMQMEAGLDTGPVLAARRIGIDAEATGGSLHDQLSKTGQALLLHSLPRLSTLLAQARPQDEGGVSYAHKLSKSECQLDFSEAANALIRKVRALNPWPVAWFELDGQRFRLWAAERGETGCPVQPGTVAMNRQTGQFEIAAADAMVRPTLIQPPGKKPMAVNDWLNGLTDNGYCGMQVN